MILQKAFGKIPLSKFRIALWTSSFDAETPRKSLLLQAFFIGLCIDIFSNTPGMNAAAATMMAFTRRPLLRMQMLRDVTDDYVPGIRSMGIW